MSDNPHHPYTLEIAPSSRQAGFFDWAIRRYGKLIERSGGGKSSEDLARKDGEKAMERQFSAALERR